MEMGQQAQVALFSRCICSSYTMASRAVQVLLPEPEGGTRKPWYNCFFIAYCMGVSKYRYSMLNVVTYGT